MKDVCLVLGFGMGLVTGVLLYRYSKETRQVVDKGEKAVKKEMDMAAKKVDEVAQKAKKVISKKTNKK